MGKIKIGDLTYVFRNAACCGANDDLGKIGKVVAIKHMYLWCTKCWQAYDGVYAVWEGELYTAYPLYMLKLIDGLTNDEKITESIHHPYQEPARVTIKPAKPSQPVPRKV